MIFISCPVKPASDSTGLFALEKFATNRIIPIGLMLPKVARGQGGVDINSAQHADGLTKNLCQCQHPLRLRHFVLVFKLHSKNSW
jgi:hypothetical protein